MNQQAPYAATATLERLFRAPEKRASEKRAPEEPPATGLDWQRNFRVDDALFTLQDVDLIDRLGVTTWALRKNPAQLDDRPLTWDALPAVLRSNILSDVVEAVGQELQYAVPFRHLGRVLTIALLPADREPIRVVQPTRRPPRVVYRDPPVPFLTLGLASPPQLARHGQLVRQVLNQPDTVQLAPATLLEMLRAIARTGEATISEMLYYLTQLRALVTGAWRYLPENYGLLAIEYLVRQSGSNNPLQPQLLAQAHLAEGRPIDWGESDPLRVTVRTG